MTDNALHRYRIDEPLTSEEQQFFVVLRGIESSARFLQAIAAAGVELPVHTSTGGAGYLKLQRTDPASVAQLVAEEFAPLVQHLFQTGDYEYAVGAATITLRLSIAVLGLENTDTITNINNLAGCLSALGRSREALSLYEHAMEVAERTSGLDHPDTLTMLNNLAACLHTLGRASEALPLLQRAFEAGERSLGPVHPDTFTTLNNLAACLHTLGRISEALPLHQRALDAQERILGPEHPDTLSSVANLAGCFYALGRIGEALPYLKRALESRERILGPDHPDALESANNLGECLRSLGRTGEALPLCQRALEARERSLGPEHPDTLTSVNSLALCLISLGRAEEALPLYRRTLKARELALGPEHPHTLQSVHNLALCFNSLGHATEALPLCQRAFDARERALGPGHPDTLVSVNSLATCLDSLGRTSEALPFLQRALQAYERTLGPEHPHIILSINTLALSLHSLRRAGQALPLFQRALKAQERTIGPEHPHTLISVNNLASCLGSLGRATEALPLYQRALEACERTLGPEHPQTLQTVNSLAACLHQLRRAVEALPYCERALEARERVLGHGHSDTLNSVRNLAQCLESLNDMSGALAQWLRLAKNAQLRPQPGGVWMQVTHSAAQGLSRHARSGLLGEWEAPFAALSAALLQAIDLQSAEQLEASRTDVNRFFSTYLDLCIDLKRPDLIPTVLATRQGRKLAAWTLEELEAQSDSLDPASLRGRFQALRLELRRLAIGLRSMEGGAGMAHNFAADRAHLSAESLIAAQRAQLDAYAAKLAEYQTLRAELAKTDPDFAVTARSLQAPLGELQGKLGVGQGLILLFERGEATTTDTRQLALLITADNATLIPLGDDALQEASQLARHWSRALFARRGMRRGISLDEDAPAPSGEDAVGITPLEALRTALQAGLWAPLTQYVKARSLTHLHLVTHGSWHVLPVHLGAPEALTLFTYPGFIYYHRLRHQGAGDEPAQAAAALAPHAGSALGLCMHAAENDAELTPIPFVQAEAAIVQALWPGTVRANADLKTPTPPLWALQYAAHGQLDERDPARASLRLGGGNLDLHALLTARQRPSVVVLSACTVGRTSDDPDGEPLGLVGGFLLKNTRYVVASLQRVPDFYMPLFMALFHEGWCAGSAPDMALAEAKRRFACGEWLTRTEALVRRHYAPVFAKELNSGLAAGRHANQLDPLLALTWVWPFPQPYRKLQPQDAQALAALRASLATPAARERMVKALVEALIAERDRLPSYAVDTLCTWVVGFGCAS